MKAGEDPRVLFNQLATIQSAYNNTTRKIDPDDSFAVVLEMAPEKVQINFDGGATAQGSEPNPIGSAQLHE
jgi:hypothetical protein